MNYCKAILVTFLVMPAYISASTPDSAKSKKSFFSFSFGGNYSVITGDRFISGPDTFLREIQAISYPGYTQKNTYGVYIGALFRNQINKQFSLQTGLMLINRKSRLVSDTTTLRNYYPNYKYRPVNRVSNDLELEVPIIINYVFSNISVGLGARLGFLSYDIRKEVVNDGTSKRYYNWQHQSIEVTPSFQITYFFKISSFIHDIHLAVDAVNLNKYYFLLGTNISLKRKK